MLLYWAIGKRSNDEILLDKRAEYGDQIIDSVSMKLTLPTKQKDRYLDLLFFHRGMRRVVGIELKLDRFEPEHKGQMEWYLRWLDKNERL